MCQRSAMTKSLRDFDGRPATRSRLRSNVNGIRLGDFNLALAEILLDIASGYIA
jgi:hypothetical protein